jgi:hypothetical protein
MTETARRKLSLVLRAASLSCLLFASARTARAQAEAAVNANAAPPAPQACAPLPTSCREGTVPGVLKLAPDQSGKLKLARRQFYLSSCPFDLAGNADPADAPSRSRYYSGKGASPELIAWLEENDCDTVYCRELTPEEVACKVGDKGCVREFVEAYAEALAKLKDPDRARKWVTMYGGLARDDLRVGLYRAKKDWLDAAARRLEDGMRGKARAAPEDSFIRSAIADEDGEVVFHDLCPTAAGAAYYFSSLAPVESGGVRLYWESVISNRVSDGINPVTPLTITLAAPTGNPARDKDGQKRLVGKPIAGQNAPGQ